MSQNVTATRMTLLQLKNQTKTAQRGHKLLKDKQDGLMQTFLKIVKEARTLRAHMTDKLADAQAKFLEAQAAMPRSFLLTTLATPGQDISLSVKTKNVMSVRIPEFKIEVKGKAINYGMLQTRPELDVAIQDFFDVFAVMIELAQIEKSAQNLADELEKTRRRVNALEYTLIPELEEKLKYVKMKLAENDRSAVVQTMAIKNMIEAKEKAASA